MSDSGNPSPWFLGPKAEHQDVWQAFLLQIFGDYTHWRRNVQPRDGLVIDREQRRQAERWFDTLSNKLDELLGDLKLDFPFFHPRYLAHMTSEQTLPGILGYFAGMLYNPNNVTLEAAPITVRYERDVGRAIAQMLGYRPNDTWAHITSGGTVSTLEALWAARTVQFVGLGLQDEHPTGDAARRLLARAPADVLEALDDDELRERAIKSLYNPRRRGLHAILESLRGDGDGPLRPLLFTSEAAHYSTEKVADVLGYGADAVMRIPTDAGGRLRVAELENAIGRMTAAGGYVAAVIVNVGTTEMGAVDPVDEVVALRDKLEQKDGTSFWIHTDAAWGGYLASLFARASSSDADEDLSTNGREADRDLRVQWKFHNAVTGADDFVSWPEDHVLRAFRSIGETDSVTIDPHKLGYVPYPAGVVAFKHKRTMDLLHQDAAYIFAPPEQPKSRDTGRDRPEPIGPYILEGSKPGAAAAACWLAHTTIPLDREHHGRIVGATVVSAQRLHRYLKLHDKYLIDARMRLRELGDERADLHCSVAIVPLQHPDSNIVCYVLRPLRVVWHDGAVVTSPVPCGLRWINALNDAVYRHFAAATPPIDATDATLPGAPHSHAYFVSRTTFAAPLYSWQSVEPLLRAARIASARDEFEEQGLIALRSTVMNPHYPTAERTAQRDYLFDFMRTLTRVGEDILVDMEDHWKSIEVDRANQSASAAAADITR